MIRMGNRDFYNFEPVQLLDLTVCMPLRWFIRVDRQGGKVVQRFFARACRLQPVLYDGASHGYLVHEWDTFDVDARQLAHNLPQMIATFEIDRLPDPRNIVRAS